MCFRTAGCAAVRVEINLLCLSNSFHFACKIANILCATDAKLSGVLLGMDFVMKAGVQGLIVVNIKMFIHTYLFPFCLTEQAPHDILKTYILRMSGYISAPTQKELSAKLRQLTESYKGVDLTEESNMTLSVWLDKWLDEYMAATLRPSTLNGYRRSLELHVKPHLGANPLAKITAADLQSLYRTLQETGRVHPRDGQSPGLSARTVHGIHTTLHHALKTAMEQNLIPSNPAAEVDPPKFIGAPMKVLTETQLDTFMTAIEKDKLWHDFFYTAVTTGLRRGEICALRWEDFDTKQGTLHVRRTLHKEKGKPYTTGDTKTYAGTREIVLPPSTAQLLQERKKAALTEWIFPNPLDPEQPTAPSTAYNHLKALPKEVGLPDIRFHDIRHTFATASLEHGMDIKTLSTIIGHVSTSTTLNVYAHVTDEMRKTAAAKIDRDRQSGKPPRI